MELAAQVGISMQEFWAMTPFELSIAAKGYGKRKEAEHKESVFQAYLISRWVWQKRINIQKILNSGEKKKPMTDDEMLERVKALNAVFGGEVRTVDKE